MTGVRCMMMRGGTSKGAMFLASDLPADPAERDDLLLRIMGSPDPGQRDGLGGGHPLTSKVAVVAPSDEPGVDVDYLFLQVQVDAPIVTATQTCGNILAAVGPFAIERGLVPATGDVTEVAIRMANTGGVARARVHTPGGTVCYDGRTPMSGLSTTAADIVIEFFGTEGSTCGALLPTGNVADTSWDVNGADGQGIAITCIDNGMPTVIVKAADLDISGLETPEELEENAKLRHSVERIRLSAGTLMGLGDVTTTTIPKVTIVAPPAGDGALTTRTFIPHRCHTSIGVLGAVTVGTAVQIPGSVAAEVARSSGDSKRVRLEHPTGYLDVESDVELVGGQVRVRRSAVVRTARKLFDGTTWPGPRRPIEDMELT